MSVSRLVKSLKTFQLNTGEGFVELTTDLIEQVQFKSAEYLQNMVDIGMIEEALIAVTSLSGETTLENLVVTEDISISPIGVIKKSSSRFMHNFQHPTGDTAIPDGVNTFVGVNAGNFTMGSTATTTNDGSYNVGVGVDALSSNTIGYDNIAVGAQALDDNTTGNSNVAVGTWALKACTTGIGNVAVGDLAMGWDVGAITGRWNCGFGGLSLGNMISGDNNTALGNEAMFELISGDDNTAVGADALYGLTTGNYNIGIGFEAGWKITGGATANMVSTSSIYIGRKTRAKVDGGDNEIVIGDSLTGLGSNTVIIGNGSTIKTALAGLIGIGGITVPTAQVHVDQSNSSGAIPVLKLDQADVDDTFIDFIGATAADGTKSISSDVTEDSAKFGAIQVEINGVPKWIRIYDNES